MRVAITGATGRVGAFIVAACRARQQAVLALSRPAFRLGDAPDLSGCDALVHCALDHVPERYRGGEGSDPAAFVRNNRDGTIRLFEAARRAGVPRVVFLSTRAIYGEYPAGTRLTEDLPPKPDTLYGEVKWQAEQALAEMTAPGFSGASLRATGVYGPGPAHKWRTLFQDFAAGKKIAPRRGTEVHGDDLAEAVQILLRTRESGAFNASDIVLDRHDLLARLGAYLKIAHAPPEKSDAPISVMDCARLSALGWRPSGLSGLERALPAMAAGIVPAA
ncbi:Nucleoside-diphosphate-sugar epimerase [Roseivivax lentus]|uniref:Nucleoside-diphosphate-sugar epimerase n=1 Tax=Roseivivax lentus TaxID=633194 RepID=A0A1N7NBA6_9RHOB|nr:NAD(P)-dependent oxidoreductase [Roseivivax lentus]SIS95592.1 Nucleoside-diphosphate-sugar epimerase [Roseivivax lentus]